MPLYQPGGAQLSGTATSINFNGPQVSSSIDANSILQVYVSGVGLVLSGSSPVGQAATINFVGNAVAGASITADGTASITMSSAGAQGPAGPTGAQGPVSSTSGSAWGAVQYATGTTTSSLYGALSTSIDPSGNLVIWAQSGSNYPPVPGPQKGVGGATFFVRDLFGRSMLGVYPTSGSDYWLQPHIGRDKIAWWNPPGNATTAPGVLGFAAVVTSGTATGNNVAATPFSATMRRLAYVSAATANNGSAICGAASQWFRGSEANAGGYHLIVRGVIDLNTVTPAQATFFCGMSASIVDTGANGTAAAGFITGVFINGVGVCKYSGSSNYYFIWNGAGGIASSSDTGIPMANGNAFEVNVYSPPNGSYVGVSMQVLQSSSQKAGTVITNANLPVNTTLTNPHCWLGNGGTAAAVRLAISSIYIGTDN